MSPRCKDYVTDCDGTPDIIIRAERYDPTKLPDLCYDDVAYLFSGADFYRQLFRFNGMMFHASAIELDGVAYLFSGPSGMGKSTHTGLWKQLFPSAKIFNDDKPALRNIDGAWYAYGTPWAGKHGININLKAPLGGICFLRRGEKNSIRRLSSFEAASAIISQTMRYFMTAKPLDAMLDLVDRLVKDVPVFELTATKDPEAAMLSYKTMRAEV